MIKIENGEFSAKGTFMDLSEDVFVVLTAIFESKKNIKMVAEWLEAFAYSVKKVDCDDTYDRIKMSGAMKEFVKKMRDAADVKPDVNEEAEDETNIDECIRVMAGYIIDASVSGNKNASSKRVKIGSAFNAISKVLEGAQKRGSLEKSLDGAIGAFEGCAKCYYNSSQDFVDKMIDEALKSIKKGEKDEG